MPQFTPRQLTETERLQLEQVFLNEVIVNDERMRMVWQELHTFFVNGSGDTVYATTFFRWYTDLTARILNELPKDVIVAVVAGRQIPLALMLGRDMLDMIITYIGFFTYDQKECAAFYKQVRDALFSSQAIVGEEKGKQVTLQEIIQRVRHVERQASDDTLQKAKLTVDIKQILERTLGTWTDVWHDDVENILNNLIGLAHFFIAVEPDKAYYMIDLHLHPEFYQQKAALLSGESTEESETVTSVQLQKEESVVSSHSQESYARIRSMIDARFPKDDAGQYVNIDGVLALLTSLAADYNDPHIAELYVYDEKQNMFMWSEDAV